MPLAPNHNYEDQHNKNRIAFFSYLQGCVAQYTDESLSPEHVMTGPCGTIDSASNTTVAVGNVDWARSTRADQDQQTQQINFMDPLKRIESSRHLR